jgi:hypothetical protein
MNSKLEKIETFMPTKTLPARLRTEQAAEILGFAEHDIPLLVRLKKLRPLGNPVPSAVKFFDTLQILDCANNERWLDQATSATYQYWRRKNERRRLRVKDDAPDQLALRA